MFTDPLLDWINQIGLSPWLAWLIFSLLSVIYTSRTVSTILRKNKKAMLDFRSHLHENVLWSIFVFGLMSAVYMVISDFEKVMLTNFQHLGFSVAAFDWLGFVDYLFIIGIVLSVIMNAVSMWRYRKLGEPLWLAGNKRVLVFMWLGSVPVGYWAIASFFRIVNISRVFFAFGRSGWVPAQPFFSDNLFGLEWLQQALLLASILFFAILVYAILLESRVNLKKVNLYVIVSGLLFVAILIIFFQIVLQLENLIGNVQAVWIAQTNSVLSAMSQAGPVLGDQASLAAALELRLVRLMNMSSGINLSIYIVLLASLVLVVIRGARVADFFLKTSISEPLVDMLMLVLQFVLGDRLPQELRGMLLGISRGSEEKQLENKKKNKKKSQKK